MATLGLVNIGALATGVLSAPRLEGEAILVENGLIAAIGAASRTAAAAADVVVDCQGTTVIPGLIDSHCHVVLGDYTPRQKTVDFLDSYVHGGITSVVSAELYPTCDIDKVRARGETWAVDPGMREAFDRLGADLRGEIRTAIVEMRTYVDDRLQTASVDTRRYFDVVGESLRGDIRAVAEGVALLSQRVDRGFAEQAGRVGGVEGRVSRLEVRVMSLEDDRKPPRPRRRR